MEKKGDVCLFCEFMSERPTYPGFKVKFRNLEHFLLKTECSRGIQLAFQEPIKWMTNFDILDKNNASPSPDKQLKFNYSEICGTRPAKAAHCIFGGPRKCCMLDYHVRTASVFLCNSHHMKCNLSYFRRLDFVHDVGFNLSRKPKT